MQRFATTVLLLLIVAAMLAWPLSIVLRGEPGPAPLTPADFGDLKTAVASPLGPEWWEVEQATVHDLDTWTSALVRHGRTNSYTRASLRLSKCDALEVSRQRAAKLKEQGAPPITDDEIRRGQAGVARFLRETQGGKRFARLVDPDAAYGRWECDLAVVLRDGTVIDVATWVRANGYERTK